MKVHIRHDPWKRMFDIVFSLGCLILFLPIFPVLALLIKKTSKGPIFYKSLCAGRGGNIIECWKFRTMFEDAPQRLHYLLRMDRAFRKEWEIFQKVKNDPRVTSIGRFLRKTSLDEIPQFWNVIKGDLSVVGPRPQAFFGSPDQGIEEIRSLFGEKADTILSVRPGITGVWQVSGRNQLTLKERYSIEAAYAKDHTFAQDLLVIAKTIPAVLFAKGAC